MTAPDQLPTRLLRASPQRGDSGHASPDRVDQGLRARPSGRKRVLGSSVAKTRVQSRHRGNSHHDAASCQAPVRARLASDISRHCSTDAALGVVPLPNGRSAQKEHRNRSAEGVRVGDACGPRFRLRSAPPGSTRCALAATVPAISGQQLELGGTQASSPTTAHSDRTQRSEQRTATPRAAPPPASIGEPQPRRSHAPRRRGLLTASLCVAMMACSLWLGTAGTRAVLAWRQPQPTAPLLAARPAEDERPEARATPTSPVSVKATTVDPEDHAASSETDGVARAVATAGPAGNASSAARTREIAELQGRAAKLLFAADYAAALDAYRALSRLAPEQQVYDTIIRALQRRELQQ